MKHLSDYILENKSLSVVPILEDNEGNIILEGFWKKLGRLFGFGAGKMKKLSDKMDKWSEDFKNAFTVSQYMAAQSKQDNISKLMSEYVDAIAQGGDAPLKFLKERAKEIVEKPELVKDKNVSQVYLGFMKNLAELSTNAKDEEGTGLANKGAGVISKQNSDIKREYERTSQQVKNVAKGPTDADAEGGEDGEATEVTDDDVRTAISNNKQLLEPLVKAIGGKLTGEQLASAVEELMKQNPAYKSKSKAAETSNIIGMGAIICGAMIMTSTKCIDRSVDWVKANNKKLAQYVSTKDQRLNVPAGDKK